MAYLGQSNSLYDPTRVTPTTVQTFNGDGVTTQFNLTYPITNSADIEVLVENVVQQPDYAYTAIGNVITFTSAPPVGTNNIYIRYGKVTGLTGTVPDGSITSSKFANNIRLFATDMYTANGVTTQWTLSDIPADANNLIVSVNGVGQAAPSNYTVSGSTITFTSAPASGANVVIRNVGFRTTQTLFAFPSGTPMVQPVITGGSANNISLINPTISGAVGIGTSNPTSTLDVRGSVNFGVTGAPVGFQTYGYINHANADNWNYSIVNLIRNSTNTSPARFLSLMLDGDDGASTTVGSFPALWGVYSGTPTTGSTSSSLNAKMGLASYAGFNFYVNGTQTVNIDSSGTLILNQGQIQFPATANPSSNANTLDDYEEGTWTPNINSNNGTGTFTTKSGTYTKIGRLVTVTFMVDGGSSLAAGTTQYLTGLPFPVFSGYAANMVVGQMGTNGPAIRTQQLMSLSANRSVLYVYSGGSQEQTTITFASGTATYLTDN